MNRHDAVRLSQLARLLFDRGTSLWYRALYLELISACLSAAVLTLAVSGDLALLSTVLIVSLLGGSRLLRLVADETNDVAQTMRRQSVLSEGLGWPIDRVQADDWARMAGPRLLRRLSAEPRPPNYYSTQEPVGPRRLAEMTLESAFYTRHLLLSMRSALLVVLGVIGVALLAGVYAALSWSQPTGFGPIMAQVLASVVLIVLEVDVASWARRLSRQSAALRTVQAGLDRLLDETALQERDVLRLVAEYDCELVDSIPIHPRLFQLRHDEIRELWRDRRDQPDQTG